MPFPDPVLEGNAETDTGYKLVVGFRPLRVIGVELQFVDFGEEDTNANGGFQYGGQLRGIWQQETEMEVSTQALVLSAVLFIPETSPRFDVYAKVGAAQLDESISARAIRRSEIECPPPGVRIGASGAGPCEFTSDVYERESGPYVGIGARFKVAHEAALRVEYEAIDSAFGDATTMFSVGIAWEH